MTCALRQDARPEEKEKKLMTLEEERLTREMERRNHQRHKAQVNLKACYNNMRASQNGLVLLAERLDAIPLLGPPLQAAGRADDDGMLPAASLQHMLNHLLLRFSRLVELQVGHLLSPASVWIEPAVGTRGLRAFDLDRSVRLVHNSRGQGTEYRETLARQNHVVFHKRPLQPTRTPGCVVMAVKRSLFCFLLTHRFNWR